MRRNYEIDFIRSAYNFDFYDVKEFIEDKNFNIHATDEKDLSLVGIAIGELYELEYTCDRERVYQIIDLLLESGVDVHYTNYNWNEDINSILHTAVTMNDNRLLDILVKNNADINIKNRYSETPLHFACYNNNTSIICSLLNHGADVSIRDRYGRTALHYACKHNNLDVIKKLLNCGSDINSADLEGVLPIALLNSPVITKYFVENNSSVNTSGILVSIR